MVFVEGAISGNVHATETLRIAASATIVGDLQSPRVAVARGAQLRGNITMRPGLTPPSDLDELAVDALLAGGRRA
jgi:cytoskeletal protein CcmA (bactofilin family)